ncbi:hypothetical protein yaldo0001_40250 [Yersinia aldovae ATCC 35236]|nr:hypothetical protein yaldo0001_40250 [Yersinia aldovae ATCC 35236]
MPAPVAGNNYPQEILSTRQAAAGKGCEGGVDGFVDNYYI